MVVRILAFVAFTCIGLGCAGDVVEPAEPATSSSSEISTGPSGEPGQMTTDDPDTTNSTGGPADGTSDDGSTGEPLRPECGDGVVVPGEICYGEPMTVELAGTPLCVTAGNLAGRGRPDVAIGYTGPRVDVYWNERDGFGAPTGLTPTGSTRALALRAADGSADELFVLTTSPIGETALEVVSGAGGRAEFGDAIALPDQGAGGLVLAELTGDAWVDAVVGGWDAGVVRVLVGESGGGLSTDEDPVPVGQHPEVKAVADIDGDRNLDVLVLNQNCFGPLNDPSAYCDPAELVVLRGDGVGGLEVASTHDLDLYLGGRHVLVADIDDDGAQDVVVTAIDCYPVSSGGPGCDDALGRVAILRGDGAGMLGTVEHFVSGPEPRAGALVDVDSDGDVDLVVLGRTSYEAGSEAHIRVHLNDGAGEFAPPVIVGPVGEAGSDLVVSDLDLDGVLDFVTVTFFPPGMQVVLSDP